MNITEKDRPGTHLADQITSYLANGGLFNPENMEHTRVRNLLLDCRDYLIRFSDAPDVKPPETITVQFYGASGAEVISRSPSNPDLAGQTFEYQLKVK